ncbi:MAG: menaquinone biosynthesis decarboxylase [Euryarchaeota archaeon]|nr:menaquinone biosynthesis decarboxylase [Euryarchaeota archaeon]
MAYSDLRDFIRVLEENGELVRVQAEVDPVLEIAEITDRVTKARGPALLFENVRGSEIPVLINTFGSPKRMQLALGTEDIEGIGEHLVSLVKTKPPKSFKEAVGKLAVVKEVLSFPPKTVRKASCQEVVLEGDDVDLTRLPVLKCWPQDAGRFITLPQVVTRDPKSGDRNVGLYRMQVYDKKTTGMHWHLHKGGAKHLWEAAQAGKDVKPLPVAVAFGGDPATMFAAGCPLPEGLDEYIFAGFLRKKRLPLVKCKTVPLEVPADAEIVLEGHVIPGELRTEGPFGDHTGYYSLADEYPVFHCSAVTMRNDPIYPTTIVGVPPQEDAWWGKSIERLFLPLLKFTQPEVVDMNMPIEGGFHNLMIISIKKRYPGQAKKIMQSIWGTGQMMFTKMIVVVDDWVDVHDPSMVMWVASHCYDPARDVVLLDGFPVDDLEHASPLHRVGGKIGIDATTKWPEEGHPRPWPDVIAMDDGTREKVKARWQDFGLGAYPEKKSKFWP